MSGFSPAVRALVYARAGERCERCGRHAEGGSVHHRKPRGMGGSRNPITNSTANALLLCGSGTTGCHGWVEANRAEAIARGWIVAQHDDPRDIPADLHIGRVLLDPAGGYAYAEETPA